jgi:hypothetical protein
MRQICMFIYIVAMNNTQHSYISKSFEGIQIQCDVHLQEESMHVVGGGSFITKEISSRLSKLR